MSAYIVILILVLFIIDLLLRVIMSNEIRKLKNDYENIKSNINKEQIINSYTDGQSHSISNYKDGEDYYNQVFKNK